MTIIFALRVGYDVIEGGIFNAAAKALALQRDGGLSGMVGVRGGHLQEREIVFQTVVRRQGSANRRRSLQFRFTDDI